jgi:phosphoglycolate phosphatase
VTIVLFDIDGTLIRTARAGSRAMTRAFAEVLGIPRAFDGVQMAGRTDRWILDEAARRCGVTLSPADVQRFRDRYAECLLQALSDPVPSTETPTGALPGVRPLLDALIAPPLRDQVFPALLTGNSEEGARIKLEHFDLWRYFRCGAYGDDVHDRNDLFRVAISRVLACGGPCVSPREVLVVGDTSFDVACATAAGARAIAVATGPSDAETLRNSGAEIVFEDLSDTNAFLRLLQRES